MLYCASRPRRLDEDEQNRAAAGSPGLQSARVSTRLWRIPLFSPVATRWPYSPIDRTHAA
jgi:hypothetical protein